MIALGVYAGPDGCAASIAHDGRILAAVNVTDRGIPALLDDAMLDTIAMCLDAAGISGGEIDQLVAVDPSVSSTSETSFHGTGSHRPLSMSLAGIPAMKVPLEVAHASLMRATVRGNSAGLFLAMDRATSGGAFVHIRDGTLTTFEIVPWVDDLSWALERTADALGGHDRSPIAYLEGIAAGDASAQDEGRDILLLNQPFSIGCDRSALVGFIETVRAQAPGPLDGSSAHVGIQRARRRLAAGVLNSLADRFEEVGRRWCEHVGADSLLQAGNIFESSEFRTRIARRPDHADTVPLPQNTASALGAALHPFASVARLESLALGASFDEQAVKTVLENCRLEYVYEPHWGRLLALVSGILSSGALVGWFQGRGDFGPQSLGSRSILADPSVPYARENLNVFLLGRDVGAALPLTLLPSISDRLPRDVASESVVTAPATHRKVLAGAIDLAGNMRVMPSPQDESLLASLLEAHHQRTGVPGLINVSMSGSSAHLASSPRDAVRSVFGSAVDMLVIGRFLVSKDRWLLRGPQTLPTPFLST